MQKLRIIVISCLLVILTNVSTASFAIAPIVIEIINNTAIDVHAQVIEARHIDDRDVKSLEQYPIYGGKTIRYNINRTDAPAELEVKFLAAAGEGQISGYSIARWKYIEYTPAFPLYANVAPIENVYTADTCHNYAAETPFALLCDGNNSLAAPFLTLTINNQQPN